MQLISCCAAAAVGDTVTLRLSPVMQQQVEVEVEAKVEVEVEVERQQRL